jgi:hypothetical protein
LDKSIDEEEYLLFGWTEREWPVKIPVKEVRKVAFELRTEQLILVGFDGFPPLQGSDIGWSFVYPASYECRIISEFRWYHGLLFALSF